LVFLALRVPFFGLFWLFSISECLPFLRYNFPPAKKRSFRRPVGPSLFVWRSFYRPLFVVLPHLWPERIYPLSAGQFRDSADLPSTCIKSPPFPHAGTPRLSIPVPFPLSAVSSRYQVYVSQIPSRTFFLYLVERPFLFCLFSTNLDPTLPRNGLIGGDFFRLRLLLLPVSPLSFPRVTVRCTDLFFFCFCGGGFFFLCVGLFGFVFSVPCIGELSHLSLS